MATFLKNLKNFFSSSAGEPHLYLAAFGKHPGWNDHIDDLGIETDQLVTAKRILYVQGINQNIDGATWEKLDPAQRLERFAHNFLWHIPSSKNSLIAGRFWSSVDGKGRDKYPMVVCVETIDLPDSFATAVALPFLIKTNERCAAAKDAATVHRIIDSDRENLRSLLQAGGTRDGLNPHDLARVARHPDMHPNREGFHRIVYQVARGMQIYRPAAPNISRSMIRRPEQIRVPTAGMSSPDALLFWLRFCLSLLEADQPILLLAPDPTIADIAGESNGWIDIIVGDPAPQNLFCIKAKNKQIPLTSDIPYTLDPSFTQAVDHFVSTCANAPQGSPLPLWPNL